MKRTIPVTPIWRRYQELRTAPQQMRLKQATAKLSRCLPLPARSSALGGGRERPIGREWRQRLYDRAR
jgi:hypothetical protein